MQVFLNTQQPNFKQIQLSEEELKKARERLNVIKADPNNPKRRYGMFDIYENHLNKEVDLKKCKTGQGRRYLSKYMYINFYKILETTRKLNFSVEYFTEALQGCIDKFDPNSKFDGKRNDPNLANYNFSSAKEDASQLYHYLGMTKDEFLNANQKYPFFQFLSMKMKKYDIYKLNEILGFNKEECLDMYRKSPQIIIYSAERIAENFENGKNTFNIETTEEYKKIVKKNPALLDYKDCSEIKERADFSNLITQEGENIGISNPAINEEETFFTALLTSAIAGALGIAASGEELNIADIIADCKNKIVELKVPKHNLSEKFTSFAKQFLRDNDFESKCKIIMKRL